MGIRSRIRLPYLFFQVAASALLGLTTPAVLSAGSLSFEEALRIAGESSPTVFAARSQIEAARHEVGPAGELPDPKLALGLDNVPISGPDRFSIDRDFMTAQRVGLMQEFPNLDKRKARVAVARARVERSEVERRIASLTAQREAAIAWIRRYSIERQLAGLAALFDENRLLEAAVRAQLAGGGGVAADVVMPRQEAALLAERRDELRAKRQQSMAALRRWVGEAADSPLAGPSPPIPVSRAALLNGLDRRPEIAVYDAMGHALDAEVREAESMKRPDWGVELAYQRRGREFGDMVMLQVSFDLPLFAATRQDPRIAAKRAEREGVDADRETESRYEAAVETPPLTTGETVAPGKPLPQPELKGSL